MITGMARADDDSVEVTVTPGGGLADLRLTERALRDGPAALADTVLAAVALATTRANRAARRTLAPGDPGTGLDAIGIVDDPAVDQAEDMTTTTTTPAWTSL